MMSEQNKPTDAEEIFAESQKIIDVQQESQPKQIPAESQTMDAPQETSEETQTSSNQEEPTAGVGKTQSDEEGSRKTRDVIFVGTKPIMTYVTATLTQLSNQPFVTIKARGQRITQAVDVSQMIVKRMNTVGYQIKSVRIASDSLMSQDGKTRNVSTIEIDIAKA